MVSRRKFLYTSAIGLLGTGLSGCTGILDNQDGIKDSDGDGMIDSKDYAPKDPDVQEKSDLEESDSRPDETASAPQSPSPSIEISALEDLNSKDCQVSGTASLNGADAIIVQHDGEKIGEFTSDGHKTFHQIGDKPAVKSSESVAIFGKWDGELHKIRDKVILGI